VTPELLVAWLDGELPDGVAARVAAAVAASAELRREADLLRRSGDLVAGLSRRAASPGFADRVLTAAGIAPGAGTRPATTTASVSGPGRLLRLPRMRIAIAAAIVAGIAGFAILRDPRTESGLRRSEEDAIARDLLVLANLDALESADVDVLSRIADDLDVLDELADVLEQGG
jgi:anti-sigma factor RsiW